MDKEQVHQEANNRLWEIGGRMLKFGQLPMLMGIVNVTPDSFSDGGQYFDHAAAIKHGLQLVEDGAEILDVGGESTRPGSQGITADEELQRVIPVIEGLAAQSDVPISCDTSKSQVARDALHAGATIINDISGLRFDAEMPLVCADSDCGVVCMHVQGVPETMQEDPRYDDVVGEIHAYFVERLESLEQAGIARQRIVVDPGIGFGKTAEHNLWILSNISSFQELGRPVLIGHSRKRFLGKVLGRKLDERNAGTIGVTVALAGQSTDIIRVHDVRAARDALLAWNAVARGI